jgi:predicted O-methyltransferase YrrM
MLGKGLRYSELSDGIPEDYNFHSLVRGTTLNSTRLYMLTLYSLVRSNGYRDLVEIGVMRGINTSFLARAAMINGGRVQAYDISGENIENAIEQLRRHRLEEYVQFWQMRSQDAQVARDSNDFVFVDGDHTYEGAYGDIRAFAHSVRLGGLLAFHDTEDEAVQRALEHIPKADWEHVNFPGDCGLALYRRVR